MFDAIDAYAYFADISCHYAYYLFRHAFRRHAYLMPPRSFVDADDAAAAAFITIIIAIIFAASPPWCRHCWWW